MTDSSAQYTTASGETFEVLRNPLADATAPWSVAQKAILSDAALQRARATITAWPGYQVSPLHTLSAWATNCGVQSVHYKDEAPRFGLGSFKALGGAYAVARLLQRQIATSLNGREPSMADILAGTHSDAVKKITVCCATDGNHGRSVAWGAQTFGCQCTIFVHATVSEARQRAIEAYGATVIRTDGNYDESVREAQRVASERNWFVVSDTSYPGYVDVPKDVMQGYELMAAESYEQLSEPPTHIFLQTGVGGMAAAVAAFFARSCGANRPQIILADPKRSACWLETLRAGKPTLVSGDIDTIMAGLACGEVSLLAWAVLEQHADAVVSVPDSGVADTMKRLAHPSAQDVPIVAGESAIAGLLALTMVAADPNARKTLKLTDQSRVLVFGTEGDTDAALYEQLTGVSGDAVRSAA